MTQTAAEAIAETLAAAGCSHAFGMPGGEVLVLLDALDRAGVSFILCKHENAAGFMAEGAWQATGAPGVLLTTIGPGLANGVNSVANAFQEQVPLVVLSGCIGPAPASQFTHQVIDQQALLAPITKASFQVAEGNAHAVVQKALALALADPPGPVHIDLPDTLARTPAPDLPGPARFTERATLGPGAVLDTALQRLRHARAPLILAGIGAVLHGAGDAIRALAETHGIPVLTTYKAKGIVPEHHPLALGGHGLSPLSDKHVLPLLRASDCILCFGYDPIEMRSDWIRPWEPEQALEFCHAQAEHGMHGSALRWVGDVRSVVTALSDGLREPLSGLWPGEEPQQVRAALTRAFARRDGWGPHAVFHALNSELPEASVLTVDSGAHRILFSQIFTAKRPGHLLQSAAFCTMGVALPLAIGVKCARPETPVVAVMGDAGLDMAPGDLATLRDMGLALTVVVLVDDALTLIGRKQAAMQLPECGVVFGRTDFVALARAYGGHGETVRDSTSLAKALNEAAGRDCFTILACEIDKQDYQGAF
ncbi:thiamine pyrophosphate-binding protein [Mesobacterium sp. TK19101]|uniref:Thiamine pyrophosphate-binding protein n=1 Tax=Mesobacterium hydrothermale TaxID=3111907 RepID=A0ABU6HL04_9RHOB|nr:thiamine pyrophosphate-binding protein [Mesobacterium sp. TK19101]MEC3863036.1 thiamine pyrophosphate-binding protein [Mesobacterium sp. TK19101]